MVLYLLELEEQLAAAWDETARSKGQFATGRDSIHRLTRSRRCELLLIAVCK